MPVKPKQAAAALRLTAEDLQSLALIDEIIPSPPAARRKIMRPRQNTCAAV